MEERIKHLETQLFLLDMKDHWTPADWAGHDKWIAELHQLKGYR